MFVTKRAFKYIVWYEWLLFHQLCAYITNLGQGLLQIKTQFMFSMIAV